MAKPLTPYQQKKSAQAWASQIHNNRHLQEEVAQADAHQLTTLLYTAILSHLKDSLSALNRQDNSAKNNWLDKALAGINELRVTLRHDLDPELAANLSDLYAYCGSLISQAKAKADSSPILEVIKLLAPIKAAWEQIAPEARQFREDLLKQQQAAGTTK